MKYILLLLFLGVAVPKCLGQFADAAHERSLVVPEPPTPIPMPMSPSVQPFFWIGAAGGVNFVHYHSASFFTPDNQPTAIAMQNGYGVAPFLGISCEIPIGRWFEENQDIIILEMFYDSKSASFNSGPSLNNVPVNIGDTKQNGNISSSMDASLSYLLVNVGYRYNFTGGPVLAGPGIQLTFDAGIKLSGKFNKTIYVFGTDSVAGAGLSHSQTQYSATEIDGIHTFRFGLRGELNYDIPFSQTFVLSPHFGYDFPFTKVDNTDRSWVASSLYAGIAVHFYVGLSSY